MVDTVLNTLAQSSRANGGDNKLTLNGTFAGDGALGLITIRTSTYMKDATDDVGIYVVPRLAGQLDQVVAVLGSTSIDGTAFFDVFISNTLVAGSADFGFEDVDTINAKSTFNVDNPPPPFFNSDVLRVVPAAGNDNAAIIPITFVFKYFIGHGVSK